MVRRLRPPGDPGLGLPRDPPPPPKATGRAPLASAAPGKSAARASPAAARRAPTHAPPSLAPSPSRDEVSARLLPALGLERDRVGDLGRREARLPALTVAGLELDDDG